MSAEKNPRGLPPGTGVADLVKTPRFQQQSRRDEERKERVKLTLGVPMPAARSHDLVEPDRIDPVEPMQMLLDVDLIQEYDKNPRRSVINESYEDIKASIRAQGIQNPITVTRRPGERLYITEAGGNTRLRATKELWQETGDDKFRQIRVLFQPWKSESVVITKHLVENNLRGSMCFWDNAHGVAMLRREIEAELGESLSLRGLGEELQKRGLNFGKSYLGRFQFVIDWLGGLQSGKHLLTPRTTDDVQKGINGLRSLAEKMGWDDSQFRERILLPMLTSFEHPAGEDSFNVAALVDALTSHAAAEWDLGASEVHHLMDAVRQSPAASLEALKQAIRVPEPAVAAVTHHEAPSDEDAVGADLVVGCPEAAPAALDPEIPVIAEKSAPITPPVESVKKGVEEVSSVPSTPQAVPVQPAPAVKARFPEAAQRLAEALFMGEAWQLCPSMPFGFYVEPVEDAPQVAWWAMAYLSGQMERMCETQLSASSAWVGVTRDAGSMEVLEDNLATIVGPAPHPAILAGFFSGMDGAFETDEAFVFFQQFLQWIRLRTEEGACNACELPIRWRE